MTGGLISVEFAIVPERNWPLTYWLFLVTLYKPFSPSLIVSWYPIYWLESYWISVSYVLSSSPTLWTSTATDITGFIRPTLTFCPSYKRLFSLVKSGFAIKNSLTFNLCLLAIDSIVSSALTV